MDGLPLMQRQAALGFEIVAESPFAVDPERFDWASLLKRARELAVAIPVLVIDDGEREAERESTGQADFEKAGPGTLGGENRDGERDGEQVARGAGEEDDQRPGEKDEHPLREEVPPVASAPDQDADADGDGSPEERIQIVESGANGEGDRVERGNPESAGRRAMPNDR